MRLRRNTCSPWVVSDDLVKKFNISNKLPALFCSPKPMLPLPKRKSDTPSSESIKRAKPDVQISVMPPRPISHLNKSIIKTTSSSELKNSSSSDLQNAVITSKTNMMNINSSQVDKSNKYSFRPLNFKGPIVKKKSIPVPKDISSAAPPRKRGRPPLTAEEKERNRKLRQASLVDITRKMAMKIDENLSVVKVKCHNESSASNIPSPQTVLTSTHPLMASAYKSPVKRAVCYKIFILYYILYCLTIKLVSLAYKAALGNYENIEQH